MILDFSAYDGQDTYSDGDIEDEIFYHVKAGNQENFLRGDNRFPVIYHLSPLRHFLLEWLPINENDSVLEIGCGLGALTSTLLKSGATVDAVEISPRRARICALRNYDAEKLTIHVGNLNAVNFNKKFDYVLLIGVLEYAARFTKTKNPYADFINKCKSLLKPDGALIIAIENRLGIEYLSGKPEDHTGKLFDGITDYPDFAGIKTFSRLELKTLLNSCGLTNQKFFYPYPDYKFPYIIHSDEMLPTAAEFAHFSDFFYDADRPELFDMNLALPTVINAGLYRDLANSFLIVAGADKILPLKILANNCPRKSQFQLRTEIHRVENTLVVRKIARTPQARRHLNTLVENGKIFSDIYGKEHVAQIKLLSDDVAEMEYIAGTSFEEYLCRSDFAGVVNFYMNKILRGSDTFSDALIDFNLPDRRFELDLNFGNIIIRNNSFVIFDYEFLLPALPKKFIAWRAFKLFCHDRPNFCKQHALSIEKLCAALKISAQENREFELQDKAFAYAVADDHDKNYRKKRQRVNSFNFD